MTETSHPDEIPTETIESIIAGSGFLIEHLSGDEKIQYAAFIEQLRDALAHGRPVYVR